MQKLELCYLMGFSGMTPLDPKQWQDIERANTTTHKVGVTQAVTQATNVTIS